MSKTKFVTIKKGITSRDLTLNESTVLSYLASLTKKDYCYASTKHLSTSLGIHERTLYRVLNKLEEKELIKRVTNSTGRYGKDRRIYVSPTVKLSYHSI